MFGKKRSGTGSMQMQKLTKEQLRMKRWRDRRNHIVCQLLAKDKRLLRREALEIANKRMRGK